MRVIISGGGTGGHIFPAIAIADGVKKAMPDAEILFVGAEGRMEMERVPKAGYEIIALPIAGLQRKLTLKNLSLPFKIWKSMRKSVQIIKSFKPDIAIGVGGYASGPVLRAAQAKGIPTIIQEQNSYAGLTNKFLSRKANKICVAYDGMDAFFPKEKLVQTGNPVRENLKHIEVSVADARKHFGLDPIKKTVLIVGGSLGARCLNEAMLASADFIESGDVQFIWQIGKVHFAKYSQTDVASLNNVKSLAFIDRMDYAYKAADILVCRAGALTISEICLLGKASILVPSPYVAEDHQTKNAQALVRKDAAVLIHENDIVKDFKVNVEALIHDDIRLNALRENALAMGKPNAVQDIVEVVKSVAK